MNAARGVLPFLGVVVAIITAATTATAAQNVERLLQAPAALDVATLRARTAHWKSSSRTGELHAFALLHLKAPTEQNQQQDEENRRGVCTALEQQLQQWQQKHGSLLHRQPQQHPREQQQLPLEEIRKLLDLLETAAAADCSRIFQPQLQGDLKPLVEHNVSSPLLSSSAEASASAALWAAVAAAAAAASVAPVANATLAAAAQVSFGLHGQTTDAKGRMLLELAKNTGPGSSNSPESAALLLYGARPLMQQPETLLPEVYRYLKEALAMPSVPARLRTLAVLLKTYFKIVAAIPSAFPSSLEERKALLLSIDTLVKGMNSHLASSRPLPLSLPLHLDALLGAADAGVFTAEIKAGQKILKFCDLWGREMPEEYNVVLHVKRAGSETQVVHFLRSSTSRCEFTPEDTPLKSASTVEFVLYANGKKRIIHPTQADAAASATPWSPVQSVAISLETENETADKRVVLESGQLYGRAIEAPALIRIKVKLTKTATTSKLAQVSVLATLREPASSLAAAIPRTTQWPLRIGKQGTRLLELKIGDPEMLIPASGLYDFELVVAQAAPLRAHSQLLFSARLVFPIPLRQIIVSAPVGDRMREYSILPAERPLHPLPIIEHTFEPPPKKLWLRAAQAPTWLALLFVLVAGVLPALGLGIVWFWRLQANMRLMRCQLGDATFVGFMLLAVCLLLHLFIYRDVFWFLRAIAVCFLPLVLATHRALREVRIRRRDLKEEERADKAK